jgi:uncharacterized protein YndB with AHSA1/START domain
MSKSIYHQLNINADPATIYDAITSQKGLSSWWVSDCEAKAELGFTNVFNFEGFPSTKMKIKKLIPAKKVDWKCIEGDKQWKGTRLSFKITEADKGSILQFKHSKWKKHTPFFATCNFHWARHFIMLKNYCENGKSILKPAIEKAEIKAANVRKKNPKEPKK